LGRAEGSLTDDGDDCSMRRKGKEQDEEKEKKNDNMCFDETSGLEEGGQGQEKDEVDQSDFRRI